MFMLAAMCVYIYLCVCNYVCVCIHGYPFVICFIIFFYICTVHSFLLSLLHLLRKVLEENTSRCHDEQLQLLCKEKKIRTGLNWHRGTVWRRRGSWRHAGFLFGVMSYFLFVFKIGNVFWSRLYDRNLAKRDGRKKNGKLIYLSRNIYSCEKVIIACVTIFFFS